MKILKHIGLFLIAVLLLVTLASASSNVATWANWIVDGQGQESATLNINRGETARFAVVVDSFAHFDIEVKVLNSDRDVVTTLFNVENLRTTYPQYYQREFIYTPTSAGTYYIVVNAKDSETHGGAGTSVDELTLNVNAPIPPPINHAPTFIVEPEDYQIVDNNLVYNAYLDDTFNFRFIGADQDNDVVHFTIENVANYAPMSGTFTNGPTATLDWIVPSVNDFAIKVTAIDEHGLQSEPKTLVVHTINRAPVLTPVTVPSESDATSWTYKYTIGQNAYITINGVEPDRQTLTLSTEFVSGMNLITNAQYTYASESLYEKSINLKWTPSGVGTYAVRIKGSDGHNGVTSKILKIEVVGIGIFNFFGCTNPVATNYNPNAFVDDGSCVYTFPEQAVGGCTNQAALNYNPTATVDDGSCLFKPDIPVPVIEGCTDTIATNYNPNAIIDDGSCLYQRDVYGCTDTAALNYNPLANIDDGSCNYPLPPFVILGCTNPVADNYNSAATIDDGSCVYTFPEIKGCTNPAATNYNPTANVDDGSCSFKPDIPVPTVKGCTDTTANNYNPAAIVDDGSCTYGIPYPIVIGCTNPAADNYNPAAVLDDGSCVYTMPQISGCTNPAATNYNLAATMDDGSCVFKLVVTGCTDSNYLEYNPAATLNDGSCATLKVSGCTNPDYLEYNAAANVDDGSCATLKVNGCTDPTADNYDSNANVDDGSCTYNIPNQAPVMESINEFIVKEGETLAFQVKANDPENNPLTYEVKVYRMFAWLIPVEVEGVTFNPQNGEFSFSPDYDFVKHPKLSGLVYANFRAFDGEEYSDWTKTKITILDVNQDPVIVSVDAPLSVLVNEEAGFSAVAKDADGDALTYTWNFDAASQNGAKAEHTFTIAGEYTITLVVTDNYGGKDTWTGIVKVSNIVVEVPGCTNPDYKEYNPAATLDDGSCATLKVKGCTNPDYIEYNSAANVDDGSCTTLKVNGCTDPEAVNYNSDANIDDSSCVMPEKKERDLYIAYAHPLNEVISAGETETFNIKVVNPTSKDIDNLRLSVILYDLNLKQSTGVFNLDSDDDTNKIVSLQIPEDAPIGDYLVKITVSNDYLHEQTYRQIVIS